LSFQRGSFRATDWCRGKRLRIHGCATLKVRGRPNALISGVRLSVALRLDRSRDRESEVRRCEKIARQAKPPAPPSFANPCTASEVGQTVSSAGPPEIRFFAASHGRGFWLAIIRLTVSFRIKPSPDDWLRRRALANQASGASRTYVVCEVKKVGCHAFAWGAIAQATVPGSFRRTQRKCKKTNDWPNGSFHHTFVGRRPIATGWKPCPTS